MRHDEATPGARRLRVAVLMGGRSPEREVSLRSGHHVIENLDPSRYDVLPVEITADGRWIPRPRPPELRTPASEGESARGPGEEGRSLVPSAPRPIDEVVGNGAVDVAFIALHGPYGEDGTVQGLLELLGIPYTGSGVLASALAMDKLRSRQVLQANGLPVPAYVAISGSQWTADRPEILRRIARDLGYPCVVKPNSVGSSIGVAVVRHEEALHGAVEEAFRYGDTVLVEEYLQGTELTCAVLEDARTGAPRPLPLVEIVPRDEFFTYAAKYEPGGSEEICPARVPSDVAQRAQELALRAHRVLGCEGVSRVDMFLVGEHLVVLEANTIPGMTPGSLLPLAARAAGIRFSDLVTALIDSALRRAQSRRRQEGV
jgi:D-alanine-D-alanine ligase